MQLARCLYVSRARADLPFWQAAAEIVGASQARNGRDDLTGALLAHQGWFVQALEGSATRLTRLLVMIGQDKRHTDMQLIEFGPIESRRFEGWAMEHVSFDGALEPRVGEGFDPRTWDPRDLMNLLGRPDRLAA